MSLYKLDLSPLYHSCTIWALSAYFPSSELSLSFDSVHAPACLSVVPRQSLFCVPEVPARTFPRCLLYGHPEWCSLPSTFAMLTTEFIKLSAKAS
eukprot:6179503-Pleurochrysis_carterae.AAC.1